MSFGIDAVAAVSRLSKCYSRRTRAVLIMRCDDELTQQNYGTTIQPVVLAYWERCGGWLVGAKLGRYRVAKRRN
jgi:hypothetical protein